MIVFVGCFIQGGFQLAQAFATINSSKEQKTHIFRQCFGNWSMISACHDMMKYIAERIKTLAGHLNRFAEV